MRQLKDWLTAYLQYTEKQESPEVFHLWSGISMISAALERRVWVDKGFFKTRANEYIILISPSARCKKSTAADIAVEIYNEVFVDDPIHSGKTTVQKFILDLGTKSKTTGASSGVLYSDELSVLVGRSGHCEMMDFLTEVYNCPKRWHNKTKSKGSDELTDICLNFLGCTTPKDFGRMPSSIIDGGFTGRNIMIYADTPREAISDPAIHFTPEIAAIKQALIHDLSIISQIEGEYHLTKNAQAIYNKLYNSNYNKHDSLDFRMQPFHGRYGEHLTKLSMIISASRHNDMIVDEQDVYAASEFIRQVTVDMSQSFVEVSYSKENEHADKILQFIEKAGGSIEHSPLLKKVYHIVNAEGLKKIIDTLDGANMIDIWIKDGKRTYALTNTKKGEK